jgi:hypothetical protein
MKEAESPRRKYTEAEILKLIGDPVELRRHMEQYDRSCDAFQDQYPELLQKYPDRWVAFFNGVLVATGESFNPLLERLRGLGIDPGHTYVRFIWSKPVDIFLQNIGASRAD